MTFVDQIKKIGRILGIPVAGSNIADCLNSLEISVTNKMVSEGKKIDTKALSKIVFDAASKDEDPPCLEKNGSEAVVASASTARRAKRSRVEKND